MKKSLIIVPARYGSKGIPRKNIKQLNGKPLIMYTLEIALQIPDSLICVTTNDKEVQKIAQHYADIIINRSEELSNDSASMDDVILDAIDRVSKESTENLDNVILLQPTSPLRKKYNVLEALKLYFANPDKLTVSVTLSKENPYYTQIEEIDGEYYPVKSHEYKTRQDCPPVYNINGSIYIFNIEKFLEVREIQKLKKTIYLMDSQNSIDIDDPIDFIIAERLLEQSKKKD